MLVYDPSAKLSRHFYMRDVAKNNLALRYNIDNTPSSQVLEKARDLAVHVLDPIVDEFAVTFVPVFWYRCEALEKLVNKKQYETWVIRKGYERPTDENWKEFFELKSHPRGEAVDIEIPGVTPTYLSSWIRTRVPEFDQLILEYPRPSDPTSGFVHVSYSWAKNRNEVFTIGV